MVSGRVDVLACLDETSASPALTPSRSTAAWAPHYFLRKAAARVSLPPRRISAVGHCLGLVFQGLGLLVSHHLDHHSFLIKNTENTILAIFQACCSSLHPCEENGDHKRYLETNFSNLPLTVMAWTHTHPHRGAVLSHLLAPPRHVWLLLSLPKLVSPQSPMQ